MKKHSADLWCVMHEGKFLDLDAPIYAPSTFRQALTEANRYFTTDKAVAKQALRDLRIVHPRAGRLARAHLQCGTVLE